MLKKMMSILSQGLSDKWIYLISWKNHRLRVFGPWCLLGWSHEEEALPPPPSTLVPQSLPPSVSKLGFKKRNRPQTLYSPLSWFIYQVSLSISTLVWRMPWGGSSWRGRPHPASPSKPIHSRGIRVGAQFWLSSGQLLKIHTHKCWVLHQGSVPPRRPLEKERSSPHSSIWPFFPRQSAVGTSCTSYPYVHSCLFLLWDTTLSARQDAAQTEPLKRWLLTHSPSKFPCWPLFSGLFM